MPIAIITGNARKFEELRDLLAPIKVEQVNLALDEIQELDAKKIIEHKLELASRLHGGECMVEDSALYLEALNGFPGPLVKWFEDSLGLPKIAEIAKALGNTRATVETTIGYSNGKGQFKFFTGTLTGQIVEPRGEKDFGYGAIFVPNGHSKTFGEMERAEKHILSMRAQAAQKLKQHLLHSL